MNSPSTLTAQDQPNLADSQIDKANHQKSESTSILVDAEQLTHTFYEVLAEIVAKAAAPISQGALKEIETRLFETYIDGQPENFLKHCAIIFAQTLQIEMALKEEVRLANLELNED